MSIFSDLLDDVLDYYVGYQLGGRRYRVLCRVSSKIRGIDFPVYEACDVLTCLHAETDDGKKLSSKEWQTLLKNADQDTDFWEAALDQFVLTTVSLTLHKSAEA